MSQIAFTVLDAAPVPYAATAHARRPPPPRGAARARPSIRSRCAARSGSSPQRRRYAADEEARLLELFGETPRWGDTLKPFLWTHVSTMVVGFTGGTDVELHVPCTYDLDVAAAKYFHALDDGEIPLILLFSGTVFAKGDGGALRVTQIPWDREARLRLPVQTWRELDRSLLPE